MNETTQNQLRQKEEALENELMGCSKCGMLTNLDFTYAFQPIVDIENKDIFGYEALVRDRVHKTAGAVLRQIDDNNRYAFDQKCRIRAISLANQLGMDKMLSINFLPNAVYQPKNCIQSTIKVAEKTGFPIERIMFEVTESEEVLDIKHLKKIFDYYQEMGFMTALDDFGAGHAGLNMLSQFVPDLIKLDMEMVRDIDTQKVKQVIVKSILEIAHTLDIIVLAEGVETMAEAKYFAERGVALMQGYLFAKPGFQSLPEVPEEMLSEANSYFLKAKKTPENE